MRTPPARRLGREYCSTRCALLDAREGGLISDAILTCLNCRATKPEPTGTPTDFYPSEHCGECPPWCCEDCGQMSSADKLCSCWIVLADLPFADVKALFAADGTFNIGAPGTQGTGA